MVSTLSAKSPSTPLVFVLSTPLKNFRLEAELILVIFIGNGFVEYDLCTLSSLDVPGMPTPILHKVLTWHGFMAFPSTTF